MDKIERDLLDVIFFCLIRLFVFILVIVLSASLARAGVSNPIGSTGGTVSLTDCADGQICFNSGGGLYGTNNLKFADPNLKAAEYCDQAGANCFDASDVAGLSGASPPGADREIVFNSGGNWAASSALKFTAGGTLQVTSAVAATTFTGALTGNSSTATALAANGSNCSAGSAPLGVDASGAAESCTDYEEDLSNSAGLLAALSDETGTGVAVFATSPTLVTPAIGVATATSVNKVAITAPATSATLTIADGATLTASANATVSGTNTGDQTTISGNAGTATALAANGGNCSAGQFPLGVDASGAVESCTALPTTITGTANQIVASGSTGAITLSAPQDIATSSSPQFTAMNIGHASDTTLARSGAGDLTIEGNQVYRAGGTEVAFADVYTEYCWAISDYNTTAITAATGLATEYLRNGTFTVTEVRAYTRTAPTGTMTIDINEAGTTILSTKLTLDANEKTSGTAAAAAVISDSSIAANAEITVDVDSTTGGKGGVVCIGGHY